ncbi:hypothetical protein [Nocardioides marmoribigeumensis]|uniref:DUF4333 domain-containing protein n=1 Tax=Nocardioides marmoribigeumensis TaxID=433649 RepID=A0ABU2BZ37_9ACTN|nr:hypothetical protein [Nocardioides marmoribigeumensis]MDR7363671.1 hypothetical protein [Nocardioides marmoribigeumensis]
MSAADPEWETIGPPVGIAMLVLGFLDWRTFWGEPRSGSIIFPASLLLVSPAYLLLRTIKLRGTPLIPVAWLVSVVALAAIGNAYVRQLEVFDWAIESGLATAIREEGGGRVRVSCPDVDDVRRDGDTTICYARDKQGTAAVELTFSRDGSYRWEWLP